MKKLLMVFLLLAIGGTSQAQLLKKIADEVKKDLEWKLRNEARKKAQQAIDSAAGKIKKKGDTKKESKQEKEVSPDKNSNNDISSNNNNIINSTGMAVANKNQSEQAYKGSNEAGASVASEEGFIEIAPSTPQVFATGMVTLTGKSIYSKEHAKNKAHILVTGGENYRQEKDFIVSGTGDFTGYWYAPDLAGDYKIKATSTDGKADTTIIIKVYDVLHLDDMTSDNIAETEKAKKKIEQKIEQAKSSISTAQKNELDAKKKKLDDEIAALLDVFHAIDDANRQLAKNISNGKSLPKNIAHHLSELNDELRKQATAIKKANDEFANHKPFDNTVCEYLVMINEACAAFSLAVAPGFKVIMTILHSIVNNKAPAETAGASANKIGISPPPGTDIIAKQMGKLYFNAEFRGQKLIGKLGGKFALDMIGYVSNNLLKMYCGIYTGEMTQRFQVVIKNKFGSVWLRYGGELKAVLSLRYPKNQGDGDIIKMKGSLEGNATKFTFFADPKEAVAEELKQAYYTSAVVRVADIVPNTVPFVPASGDIVGLGAVARGLVTPASFYIPIDAEYNVDAGQIKIFVNEAILDFTSFIENKQIFVVIAVLPIFKKQVYPIDKAQKLIWGSLKEKNWFPVTGEEEGKPRFSGTVTRKINQQDLTIDLEITLTGKKN